MKTLIVFLVLLAFSQCSAVRQTRFEVGYHVGPGDAYEEELATKKFIQMQQNENGQYHVAEYRVDFSEAFDTIPQVGVASSLLDMDVGHPAAYKIDVTDVSTTGFTLSFMSLNENSVFGHKVNWFATDDPRIKAQFWGLVEDVESEEDTSNSQSDSSFGEGMEYSTDTSEDGEGVYDYSNFSEEAYEYDGESSSEIDNTSESSQNDQEGTSFNGEESSEDSDLVEKESSFDGESSSESSYYDGESSGESQQYDSESSDQSDYDGESAEAEESQDDQKAEESQDDQKAEESQDDQSLEESQDDQKAEESYDQENTGESSDFEGESSGEDYDYDGEGFEESSDYSEESQEESQDYDLKNSEGSDDQSGESSEESQKEGETEGNSSESSSEGSSESSGEESEADNSGSSEGQSYYDDNEYSQYESSSGGSGSEYSSSESQSEDSSYSSSSSEQSEGATLNNRDNQKSKKYFIPFVDVPKNYKGSIPDVHIYPVGAVFVKGDFDLRYTIDRVTKKGVQVTVHYENGVVLQTVNFMVVLSYEGATQSISQIEYQADEYDPFIYREPSVVTADFTLEIPEEEREYVYKGPSFVGLTGFTVDSSTNVRVAVKQMNIEEEQHSTSLVTWGNSVTKYLAIEYFLYEPMYLFDPKCAQVFSECNFEGSSMTLCQEEKDFQNDAFQGPIKSWSVPVKSILHLTNAEGQTISIGGVEKCAEETLEVSTGKHSKQRKSTVEIQ